MGRNRLLNLLNGLFKSQQSDPDQLRDFLKKLGINPHDLSLFEQAFRHVTVSTKKNMSNERLEFVGDAILDAVVANYAFNRFPDREEGFLSKFKSAVVNRKTLNKLARDMKLEQMIDANVSNRKAMHVIGGNALEALVGAIYQDQGYAFTYSWIEERIIKKLDLKKLQTSLKDPKSTLYERAHQESAKLEFKVASADNSSSPPFEAIVLWDGKVLTNATSSSKKEAEQKAARKALTLINGG